jgi:Xaa-Pro aminopeptidase
MRTVHPVLKRGGLFWDRDLLPVQAFRERYARMQEAIAAAGDDAWLLYGDVERYGSVCYVSNFLPRTRSSIALVPRKGEPVLLVSVGLRDIPAAKSLTWIEDVRPFLRLPKVLIDLIKEQGLEKARLGLVGLDESMPITEWEEIETGLPTVSWQPRGDALLALRQRKDSWELTAMRRVAAAIESALDMAPNVLKPGITMRDAISHLDREIRRKAAEDVRFLVASGEQVGGALRPADDRVLQQGDVVMLYVAAEIQRYWAEGARTYVLGAPSAELLSLAGKVSQALGAMRERARTGVAAGQVFEAASEKLGDLSESAARYGIGHGIGLDADEAPFIEAGVGQKLLPETTLGLHLIVHAGRYGIAVGQTVVARGDQCESLNDAPALVECRIAQEVA